MATWEIVADTQRWLENLIHKVFSVSSSIAFGRARSESPALLQQVYLDHERDTHHTVSKSTEILNESRFWIHTKFQEALLKQCSSEIWPLRCNEAGCSRPILLYEHHLEQLRELNDALTAAITDIVRRWWRDTDRCFPQRMPLRPQEEELLKWIDEQVTHGGIQDYSSCQGSWRPDFMVEQLDTAEDHIAENFRITEINARYSFNGFIIQFYGQKALESLNLEDCRLRGISEAEIIVSGLLELFNPTIPLYFLVDAELAMDIAMLPPLMRERFGAGPRYVKPDDMRLQPDAESAAGYKLYCVRSYESVNALQQVDQTNHATDIKKAPEEIQQVVLELKQHELLALDTEIVRQLAIRSFSDLRTIFLVHDKRLLGIVKEELEDLKRRGILTEKQTQILDRGIANSILPGSDKMQWLLYNSRLTPQLKNDYLLKPIRGGKGLGILFGEDITNEEWLRSLETLQSADLGEDGTFVIQQRITPRMYDLLLQERQVVQNPLTGTWHIVNGQFLGPGVWRSSSDRICAVSSGGTWLGSVMGESDV